MKYKSIFSSFFGLGIIMAILQYPVQYIFKLMDMAQMHSLALALAGLASATLFTYYLYPRIMSPLFKIYAMATTLCISFLIGLIVILSNSTLRAACSQLIELTFQEGDILQRIVLVFAIIFGLLIQFGIWYFFITFGNKTMLKALEAQKK